MKKTFPLKDPARDDQRVIEAIKHDVRKYAKRERRKPVPEGFDLWELQCRVGPGAALSEARAFKEVPAAIDAVGAAEGATAVYVEIVAVAAKWPARPTPEAGEGGLMTDDRKQTAETGVPNPED